MSILAWNKLYHTEIDIIDDQLIEFIDTINLLNRSIILRNDPTEILNILGFILDWAYYHFKTEENLMMQIYYSDKDMHIKQHEEFLRKINNFARILKAGYQFSYSNITSYLIDWFNYHVTDSDKEFARLFNHKIAI